MDERVFAKAKSLERAMAHDNPEGRQWLRIGHADSYNGESNRIEAWLLEGSPARGFILFRVGEGTAYRLSGYAKLLKTFHAFDDAEENGRP